MEEKGKRGVLKDFWSFIRHLSSVVKSVALKKSSYPQVPGSIPAESTSSDSHGFEQIDPEARVVNYCFHNKSNLTQKKDGREAPE